MFRNFTEFLQVGDNVLVGNFNPGNIQRVVRVTDKFIELSGGFSFRKLDGTKVGFRDGDDMCSLHEIVGQKI